MKSNIYKKVFIISGVLLLLVLIISLLFSFLAFNNNNYLMFVNGFSINDNSQVKIVYKMENTITSSSTDINFKDVNINFYPNANFKYEVGGLPMDFNNLYDLDNYDQGGGKNINSAFEITKNEDSIVFVKDKKLEEIISFYKPDAEFNVGPDYSVAYYRCEISYENFSINFLFGENDVEIILDNLEVIF